MDQTIRQILTAACDEVRPILQAMPAMNKYETRSNSVKLLSEVVARLLPPGRYIDKPCDINGTASI